MNNFTSLFSCNHANAVDGARLVLFCFFSNPWTWMWHNSPTQKQVHSVSLGSLCFVPQRMTCSQSVCVYIIQQLVLNEAVPKHTLQAARTLRPRPAPCWRRSQLLGGGDQRWANKCLVWLAGAHQDVCRPGGWTNQEVHHNKIKHEDVVAAVARQISSKILVSLAWRVTLSWILLLLLFRFLFISFSFFLFVTHCGTFLVWGGVQPKPNT